MEFYIREAEWTTEQAQISAIRQQVFVMEQHVPPELEWDGLDETATHLIAIAENGKPIGCARILIGASIGRMAVLEPWRGQGVGWLLLQTAIGHCRQKGWLHIQVSAQIHAISFYEKAGFQISGDEYMDAGILHRAMTLHINS